jgi:hypothetical protein
MLEDEWNWTFLYYRNTYSDVDSLL